MSTYQRWHHLKSGEEVRGVWECCGREGKAPHIGPYLPIKICMPPVYCVVWYRGIAHQRGGGVAVLIELY